MTLLGQFTNFDYGLHIRYWHSINIKFPEFSSSMVAMQGNVLVLRRYMKYLGIKDHSIGNLFSNAIFEKCVYVHVCVYICIHTYICMYICVCLFCVYVHIRIHKHPHRESKNATNGESR